MPRFFFYTTIFIIGTFLNVGYEFMRAQQAYDNGDLSAFAVFSFLPLIFPVFMIYPAIATLVIAVVVEAAIFLTKLFNQID